MLVLILLLHNSDSSSCRFKMLRAPVVHYSLLEFLERCSHYSNNHPVKIWLASIKSTRTLKTLWVVSKISSMQDCFQGFATFQIKSIAEKE